MTQTDTLGEQIVTAGFAANQYLLDMNGALCVPRDFPLAAPWNLPSGLFQFPIETAKPDGDQPRKIGLRHPMLAEHPFVKHVEATLGITLDRNGAPNRHGYSTADQGRWRHAVDLMTAEHYRDLIDTQDFTDPAAVFGAIAFACRYSPTEKNETGGYLSTAQARIVMDEMGACEPDSRSEIIRQFHAPKASKQESGAEHWPINHGAGIAPEDIAWAFIHGIEDGWFIYDRCGHLQWSQLGRDRYAAGESISFTETSGQAAFAF